MVSEDAEEVGATVQEFCQVAHFWFTEREVACAGLFGFGAPVEGPVSVPVEGTTFAEHAVCSVPIVDDSFGHDTVERAF